jgi:hypothetical protein
VSTVGQHVHSLLEISPLTAALLLTVLHWDQAAALAGGGRAGFGMHLKRRHPLPPRYRAGLLAAITVAGVLPYAEEFWGCWRPIPACALCPNPPSPPQKPSRSVPKATASDRRGSQGDRDARPGRRALVPNGPRPGRPN